MEAQCYESSRANIQFCGPDYVSALHESNCLIILTEWDEFKEYDYNSLIPNMANKPIVYDLRAYMDVKSL
jgi:UDP-glucose 6-dehydrogenase